MIIESYNKQSQIHENPTDTSIYRQKMTTIKTIVSIGTQFLMFLRQMQLPSNKIILS